MAKLTDTDETFSDALKDRKVYVSEGYDKSSVQDLQKILQRMGAKAVANACESKVYVTRDVNATILVASTDFIVATDSKNVRTAGVIKKNAWNVVSGQWLLRCLKRRALLPWFVHCTVSKLFRSLRKQDDMIHQSDASTFHLFDVPEPAEAEEVEEEEQEEEAAEEVESILGDVQLDADDAAAIETEFGIESEEDPVPSTLPLDIESETPTVMNQHFLEQQRLSDVTVYGRELRCCHFRHHLHGLRFPLPCVISEEPGSIVHGEGSIAGRNSSWGHGRESNAHRHKWSVSTYVPYMSDTRLSVGFFTDSLITLFFRTTDHLDELYNWNQKKKHWLGTFVTAEWIDLSIEEEDRYRVGENPQNLLKK